MTAIESEWYLHPYICEGCLGDVPLTERQYEKAMDYRGRLLCEKCLEEKLLADAKRRADRRGRSRGG